MDTGRIADAFLALTAERLDRPEAAAQVIATLDGIVLLDIMGRGDVADKASKEVVLF